MYFEIRQRVELFFLKVTEAHPYMGGFVKFAILASMGDALGGRILKGYWKLEKGFIWKAVVWGILQEKLLLRKWSNELTGNLWLVFLG